MICMRWIWLKLRCEVPWQRSSLEWACVYLPTHAHNVVGLLPAFARRCCSNRSISPARRAHSSKPAAAGLLLWANDGTDTRTGRQRDTVPFHRPCAPHTTRAVLRYTFRCIYRVAQNKIPHWRICNISATGYLILKNSWSCLILTLLWI